MPPPDDVRREAGSVDASRFRRPDRAPASAPPSGDPDVLLPADGVDGPPGAAEGGRPPDHSLAAVSQTRALAEPLAALAAAFQANAEALRRSQEVTADLGRALQRADRSELLLQSTGALNDTFKGVTAVQRTLIQRIEESGKEAREGRWFLPLIVLAAVALVGGVAWVLVDGMSGLREDVMGTGDVATQLSNAARDARDETKAEWQARLETERTAHEERLRAIEDRLRSAEAERDAEKATRQSVEGDLTAARAELSVTRVDTLKVRALEDEANRLRAEQVLKDPEIERLKREVAEEKRVSADLRKRLADAGLSRPVPAGPPTEPIVAGDGAPPASAEADDGSLTRERAQLDRARGRLNELLQTGAANRADYLQVNRVGGMGLTRLVDVQATRHGPTGKPLNSIRAKELRIVVDRQRRVVEFTFTEGSLDFGGSTIPFPNGVFTSVVADGDAVGPWNASGLSVVTAK